MMRFEAYLALVKYSFSGKLLAVQIVVAKRLKVSTHINLLSRNEAWKLRHLQRERVPGPCTIGILGITVGSTLEAPHQPPWRTFHVGLNRMEWWGRVGVGRVRGFVWLQEALRQEKMRHTSLTDGLLEV